MQLINMLIFIIFHLPMEGRGYSRKQRDSGTDMKKREKQLVS